MLNETEFTAASSSPEEVSEAAFEQKLAKEFPKEYVLYRKSGMSRRNFLKMTGASLALGGFTLAGCAPANPPAEPIVPYARMPEGFIPGRPQFFATTMTLGGFATGMLVETHGGRPSRLEGNRLHPASLGGSDAMSQASILELYSPLRSTVVRNEGAESSWEEFESTLAQLLADPDQNLRILTETVTSPTIASQIETLLEMFPNARWYQYEPVNRDPVVAGARIAFGDDVNIVYKMENAKTVLSLDADFMASMPGSTRYARDFAAGRKVRAENLEMNRLYAVESTPGITGANADHRLAMRASTVEAFALALADALGVGVGSVPDTNWDAGWFDAAVADLQAHAGESLVIPGEFQSPAVHALAHAINDVLGNVGNTVTYTEPVMANTVVQAEEIAMLVDEMTSRDVDALIIFGGNPAYNTPADLDFAGLLDQVPFSAHLSLFNNDTSSLVDWHLPETHFLEMWSDGRAYDGTLSLGQPPIAPAYENVRSAIEVLALMTGDDRRAYDIVRATWEETAAGSDFEAFWRKSLHDGLAADTAAQTVDVSIAGSFATDVADALSAPGTGLELVFRPDPYIWDGRFASNSWLQELPHPLSKITWDMAAYVSEATAERLSLTNGAIGNLTFNGRSMDAPFFILHGHPDDCVSISLGYGQTVDGETDADEVFNAYLLRGSEAMWHGTGLEVDARSTTYLLARSRAFDMHDEDENVRAGTLQQFRANPDFAHENHKSLSVSLIPPLEDYSDNYAWGMTIDLTSCVGCNACMIACQMENNIPTVGKEGIDKGRDMSWIRIDRYYVETEEGDLHTQFQPVPCMHCENAPCELVCPVQATVHDHEGLNNMVYNRCIGTRYCSANCPYGVRRFNFMNYQNELPILQEWHNPDVSVRPEGVMEKCTFCVQRISSARIDADRENRTIRDGEVVPACAWACPTEAIAFGDINDTEAVVTQIKAEPHNYGLFADLNTIPRTTYLARLSNPNESLSRTGEEEV